MVQALMIMNTNEIQLQQRWTLSHKRESWKGKQEAEVDVKCIKKNEWTIEVK